MLGYGFCGTSGLRAQTTLKLCFIFLRHFDVSFIMSQLRYQCLYYSNTLLMALKQHDFLVRSSYA